MLNHADGEQDEHLSTMQRLVLESEDIAEFLRDFTGLLARKLSLEGPARWCAITLLRDRGATTAVSSSPQARALDELQNRFDDGPCMTAIRENTVIRAGDLREDDRWPDYAATAIRHGVRAVVGIPFDLDEDAQAGLNVYSATPHDFSPETIRALCLEVEQASNALRLAVRMAKDRDSNRDLLAAMQNRTVIDLAVGIIMGQNRCSQERAVEILKTASNHRNVKLRELAEELVASVDATPTTTAFEI